MESPGVGLRERKKRQTRAALVANGLRLFAERGYDDVAVAEIAAAAGVSTRTFFGYFPHKADVLFAGAHDRLAAIGPALAAQAAAGAEPVAGLRDALGAGLQATGEDLFGPHAHARMQLVLGRPDLQQRATHLIVAAGGQLVRHLVEAYPDQYDTPGRTDAVALVGGLLGGVVAAVTHGVTQGHAPERIHDAVDGVFERFGRLYP